MNSAFYGVCALLTFLTGLVFRVPLEVDPVLHVLVLLPLLALSGAFAATALSKCLPQVEAMAAAPRAAPLVWLAVVTILFWMLPRYIDKSLVDPVIAFAKFTTLPLLAGAPLALAWKKIHPFLRGFLKANCLSMLGVLAFLYTHAPVRICNSYLVSDQERLGLGFLYAAVGLGLFWAFRLFLPPKEQETLTTVQPEYS